MFQKDTFKDKIVLVTGGRSGIGFQIAKDFLLLGATVFICSRKEEKLLAAAEQLKKYGEVYAQSCDIRNSEEISALATFIKETKGRLDILINNAGGQFPALAEYISDNGWMAVINNNLNGTFFITKIMAKEFFIPQASGNVVNIIADIYRGFPGMAHTGAARAGVDNLTKSLAQEWARSNMRLNCVAPGYIDSSGLENYPQEIQDKFAEAMKAIPLQRFGTVEEVSNAVCFLSSDLASYISGTTLYVDGAQHLNFDKMGLPEVLRSFM